MSRLIDRILAHGLSVANSQLLTGLLKTEDLEKAIRSELSRQLPGVEPQDDDVRRATAWAKPPPARSRSRVRRGRSPAMNTP